MAAKNDITGDLIKSKQCSELYAHGWDLIFKKKKPELELDTESEYSTDSGVADYE